MSNYLSSILQKKLNDRSQKGNLRTLRTKSESIDFLSNDYLGLSRSKELHHLILERVTALPISNGSTGSRLLSGNTAYTEEVELKLATIFNAEAALIFNSGYNANLGVLSSVPQRGDTIFYDEYAHSSLKDGTRLSMASHFSFKHNDLNDLEKKIRKTSGHSFIVVESIYSMDGDQCPLEELVELTDRYDSSIVLDEAHSTGVLGSSGAGLAASLGLQDRIPIRIYTFGKAMGVHGACVTGSTQLINFLLNFSRSFIYTTALSPHDIAAIDCSFAFLNANIELQDKLRNNIQIFKKGLERHPLNSDSAIQAFIIPGNTRAIEAATNLQKMGFEVRPILHPTVPENKERLRICIHTFNTADEIAKLTQILRHAINSEVS